MATPSRIRPPAPDEHQALKAGLRSPDAFTLRRCQILLASADGLPPSAIADRLGCASQTVRNAIRAFDAQGLACLPRKSNRPRSARPELDDARCQRLRAILHRSPRDFGKPTGLWTLAVKFVGNWHGFFEAIWHHFAGEGQTISNSLASGSFTYCYGVSRPRNRASLVMESAFLATPYTCRFYWLLP